MLNINEVNRLEKYNDAHISTVYMNNFEYELIIGFLFKKFGINFSHNIGHKLLNINNENIKRVPTPPSYTLLPRISKVELKLESCIFRSKFRSLDTFNDVLDNGEGLFRFFKYTLIPDRYFDLNKFVEELRKNNIGFIMRYTGISHNIVSYFNIGQTKYDTLTKILPYLLILGKALGLSDTETDAIHFKFLMEIDEDIKELK